MDRWGIYEMLKGNNIDIDKIQRASADEVKEGVIEYLIVKEKGMVES